MKRIIFIIVFLLATSIPFIALAGEVDISDRPLETTVISPPPLVMFLLDDSGSMDWEIMTHDYNGLGFGSAKYPFSNSSLKPKWKSQWAGYNKIFYNPHTEYIPWAGDFDNASKTKPYKDPVKTSAGTLTLTSTYATISDVSIKNAHYYTKDPEGNIYLVNFDSGRKYYLFNDNDPVDKVDTGELSLATSVPDSIKEATRDEDGNITGYYSDEEALQNFANWYTYYRKREYTIKAAVGQAISSFSGVKVGMYGINNSVNQEVLPVNLEGEISGVDSPYIVDNKQTGLFSTTGTWQSTEKDKNAYKKSTDYTYGTGIAKWQFNLQESGTYKVYAYNCCDSKGDPTAAYTVHHASTDSGSIDVNQKKQWSNNSCYDWVLLGSFNFDSGSGQYVTLQGDGYDKGWWDKQKTTADAIKLEKTTSTFGNIDKTDELLDILYSTGANGSTPLRRGLQEIGKYFQGQNTSIGLSPYYTSSNGGQCQKAFAIAMTDGYWNGLDPYSINDEDSDGHSKTLADVAAYYYNTDLSSSLGNHVPIGLCDKNKKQHMVTHSVSLGVTGTIDPFSLTPQYSTESCFAADVDWPEPVKNQLTTVDDLFHAAINGKGLYFSAQNPQQLVDALTEIVGNVEGTSSGASVSVNSNEMQSGLVVYQSLYESRVWSGDVIAYPVDPISKEVLHSDDKALWFASEQMPEFASRKIYTYDGTHGIEFKYSSLTSTQKGQLLYDSESSTALAEARLNYLRGDISNTDFRSRESIHGDIVHSSPKLSISGKTIFYGANDGMLHAIESETGKEMFNYIPNLVFSNLKDLTKKEYDHNFYVDQSPSIIGLDKDNTWLVGTLGKGGKGLFGLKIYERDPNNGTVSIDADSFSSTTSDIGTISNMIKWEYPKVENSDDDLGYTFSNAAIVRSNSDNPDNKWVVIIGNGYNSKNEKAVLYILSLKTGEIIKTIDTLQGGANGLSGPAVIDKDGNYTADYAYAGDLNGNLWKFDLTSTSEDDWDIAYKTTVDGKSVPKPLFVTSGQSITSRPDVMYHPTQSGYLVIFGTGQYLGETDQTNMALQTIYGVWDYGDDADDGAFLGEVDTKNATALTLKNGGIEDLSLVRQTVVDARLDDEHLYRTLSNNEINWAVADDGTPDGAVGWFFDLRSEEDTNDDDTDDGYNGERIVKDVLINNGRAFIVSFIPNNDPCSGGGNSFLYILNAATGGRLSTTQFDLNAENGLFELDDGDPDTKNEMVAPTGKMFDGMLHEATFVTGTGDKDKIYISSSIGEIFDEDVEHERVGQVYWKLAQ